MEHFIVFLYLIKKNDLIIDHSKIDPENKKSNILKKVRRIKKSVVFSSLLTKYSKMLKILTIFNKFWFEIIDAVRNKIYEERQTNVCIRFLNEFLIF
jgi:hypothetical protein